MCGRNEIKINIGEISQSLRRRTLNPTENIPCKKYNGKSVHINDDERSAA